MEWISARELAGIPGMPVDRNNVRRRAEREGWDCRTRAGKGGGREYHVTSLPVETQQALGWDPLATEDFEGLDRALVAETEEAPGAELDPQPEERQLELIPSIDWDKGQAIWAVLGLWRRYWADCQEICPGKKKREARQEFCRDPLGCGILISKEDRNLIAYLTAKKGGTLSVTTLHNYENECRQRQGSGYQKPRRFRKIEDNPRIKSVIWNWLRDYLKPNISLLHEYLDEVVGDAPSITQLRSYVQEVERTQARILAEFRNPDSARSKYGIRAGTQQYETRPSERWEWDGTPSDVLLPGHGRYSLLVVVDNYTRRAQVLVSRSISSEGYSLLLYKCLRQWGLPESLRSDCGSAENSARIVGTLAALGIVHEPTKQYSPQEKGRIERLNRTVNSWLEHHPNFKGHNVAEAQALRHQKSFAERASGQKIPTVACSPSDLQAYLEAWLERYHHDSHQGLGGKSPDQVYREALTNWTPRVLGTEHLSALRILLTDGGKRVVTGGTVRYKNGTYVHSELGNVAINGQTVEVREDPTDQGIIHVFSADFGEYVCSAEDAELLGAHRKIVALATKKVEQVTKARIKAEFDQHRKQAGGKSKKLVQQLVSEQAAKAPAPFGVEAELVATPALEAAAEALASRAAWGQIKSTPLTEDQRDRQKQILAELADQEARESAAAEAERARIRQQQQKFLAAQENESNVVPLERDSDRLVRLARSRGRWSAADAEWFDEFKETDLGRRLINAFPNRYFDIAN